MYKILIVEDDMTIAKALSNHLQKWNYEVKYVEDFKNVYQEFQEFEPQIVLLDISLPFYNGFYWCTEIRKVSEVPIMFISSMVDNMNIVMAINMGGDEFIEKPFDLNVITAKIQGLLRRTYAFQGSPNVLEREGVLLNISDATLTFQEQKLELTKNDYKIVQILMERAGKIVAREEIMERLWASDEFIDDNTLTVNITRLRKKLEEIGLKDFIITKKGKRVYDKMMELLKSYIRKNVKLFVCLAVNVVVFTIIFYLYSLPLEPVRYAFLLVAAIIFVMLGIDFSAYVKKYRSLQRMANKITFELDEFEAIEDLHEKEYINALRTVYEMKEQLESKMRIDRQEMTDYYTLWGHQIKVPIAAMRLLLQSGEMDIGMLSAELFKIEQYVEMVLSYLRMESMSADMVLQEYALEDIVKQAIRKYSKLFILKKIKLEFSGMETKVVTDEKWVCFVIEQLLSNALKYTNEGKIAIYMDENQRDVLVIEDTGMGISAEDLPRVTEKGFTGYNGRADKKSTGLGLYLCKTVLDKLGHTIRLESEPGVGTKVYVSFQRESNLT